MVTGFIMVDRPNLNYTQGQPVRRNDGQISGVGVIHTFESWPDLTTPDFGAENGVKYLQQRTTPGCYHRLADSDSRLQLYPYQWETWHCRITNNHSTGFCMATRAEMWGHLPASYRDKMMENSAMQVAEWVGWCQSDLGLRVPIRWLTRAEALRRTPGLITHGKIGSRADMEGTDPTRRHDPGSGFARALYLEMVGDYAGSVTIPGDDGVGGESRKSFLPLWTDGDEGHRTITEEERALKKTGDYGGLIEADAGRRAVRGPVLELAEQRFLKRKGHYRGRLDGLFEEMSIRAEQHWLATERLYPYQWIDGRRGVETIRSLQTALNHGRLR
jgi:hypothetical protein